MTPRTQDLGRNRFGSLVRSGALLAAVALMAVPVDAMAQGRGGPPLSLPAARNATFTATEGTWISLDVSPDGQTIVFDLLGDLYTMPIEGGTATPLLTGMAFDVQPRFSPDGERLVSGCYDGKLAVWDTARRRD